MTDRRSLQPSWHALVTGSSRVFFCLTLAGALAAGSVAAAALPPPSTASPGDPTRFAIVSGPCPTFLWGTVADADRYEIAVYVLDENGAVGADASLLQSLPGSIGGWTPESGRCPKAGGHYAWTVRAVVDGSPTEWSETRFFRVSEAPAIAEVEEALDVLRRFMGETASREPEVRPRAVMGPSLPGAARPGLEARGSAKAGTDPREPDEPREPAPDPPEPKPVGEALTSGGLVAETISPRIVTFPAAYSLGLDGDLVLEGNVFKDGYALLHTDGGFDSGNTAFGLDALVSATPDVPTLGDGEFNSAFGQRTLRNNTEGALNTAIGGAALYSNTLGDSNTALGAVALPFNTTGAGNTAAGTGALYANTTGDENTAVGNLALRDNTTGFLNSALGYGALRENVSGIRNSAIGSRTLHDNTTGDRNTALGDNALRSNSTGSDNTATGSSALRYNTTGNWNTASGRNALRANTSGSFNTATGALALRSNTTGRWSTANGYSALRNNTTGDRNTAAGFQALEANTNGDWNTAMGADSLRNNTTGERNTAAGTYALTGNTTGYRNTSVGWGALRLVTDGYRNLALGHRAGSDLEDGDDNIYLANDGVASESGRIRIGEPGVHGEAFIAGIWGNVIAVPTYEVYVNPEGELGVIGSSRRFKEEIEDMGEASERLMKLRPVTFKYSEEVAGDGSRPRAFGLIAEEVAEVLPELVAYDAEGEPLSVRYGVLPAMLLNELQSQVREIRHLRERLLAIEGSRRRPVVEAPEEPPQIGGFRVRVDELLARDREGLRAERLCGLDPPLVE